MGWHIQVTTATARYFRDSAQPAETSFAKRVSPDAIVQLDMAQPGKAYIHATMSRADGSTPAGAWRELARMLRTAFGVTALSWDHKRKATAADPARAWVDTVAES